MKFGTVQAAIEAVEGGETEIWLSNAEDRHDMRPLLKALKDNRTVTHLMFGSNFGGMKLGDEGAALIADMLRHNSSIQTLGLNNNNIGPDGAVAIAEGLKENSSIQSLDLAENSIGDTGAVAFAEGLKENSSIQSLDLYRNQIGDAGAVAIADMLKENTSTTELFLWSNNIGDAGVEALAEMLKTNTSLRTLLLNGNTCTAKGGEALAAALESNEALKTIGLPWAVPDNIEARIRARVLVVEQQYNDFGAKGLQMLNSNVEVRWGRAKLMVVGKGAAGKSSFVRTLLWQVPIEVYDSTIGVDLKLTRTRDWAEREADTADLDEQLAKAQFLAGAVAESVPAPAPAPAPVPAPTPSPAVQVKAKDIAESYRADLKARVQQDGGKTVAEEVSFTIWDYGGQEVFYSLHHLFLTSNGVYVLAFDMRELVGRERFKDSLSVEAYDALDSVEGALATLRFWLNSIAMHAPDADVMLVGTYMDAVSRREDWEAVNDHLESIGVDESERTEYNKADGLWFFPVDNMDRSDAALERAQRLRDVVVGRVKDTDYVTREVPLRWALLQEKMLADKGRNYMELGDVKKLALEVCGIEADEVTEELLPFLHELGVVVHLTATPTLANIVVTRPQWLLDNLARVICDPRHMKVHKQALLSADELPRDLRKDLKRWEREGIATRALLEWLWQGRNVDYFVDLMQEMLLASPVDATSGAILVPSLHAAAPPDMLHDVTASFADGPLAYVQFKFLPKGVFQRFVTSLAIVGPELVHIRNVCADLALVTVNNTNLLLAPDAASKRVLIRFMPQSAQSLDVAYRVMLVLQLFSRLDDAFMKTSLQPSLVLSANSTDEDDACATFVAVSEAAKSKTASTNNPVLALSRKALCVADFNVFLATPEASSITNAGAAAEVFISYRRTHIWLALSIHLSLEQLGYNVFLDILPETSGLGDFQARLESNLRAADFVIVLLTPSPSGPDARRQTLSSLESVKDAARSGTVDWCYRELQLAMEAYRKGKQMVIPVWRDIDLRANMRDLPGDIADLEALEGIELKDDRMFREYVQLLHNLMQKHPATVAKAKT